MPRQPRVVEPGSVVHVATRGALKAPIFRDDSDRRRFLTLLASVGRQCDWGLLAYCLMANHYHLLIEPRMPTLSKGMQLLNGQYASIFNDRHGKQGCLFQARFWSGRVETERYLHAVVRYIAMNPVSAGLCRSPEDWRWGGHRELMLLDRRRFVDTARTFELLGGDHAGYRSLFTGPADPVVDLSIRCGSESSWEDTKRQVVAMHSAGFQLSALAQAVNRDLRTVRRWVANATG